MFRFGHPTRDERLRHVAANLGRAYWVETEPESASPRTVTQMCEGVDPHSSAEHLVVCPECGQVFDCRDQDQVAHHNNSGHAPKLRKST